MKGKSQKNTTWLKSIIMLLVTLLLGTTAWNGVQEDVSNDSNSNANQVISAEESNPSTDNQVISENTGINSNDNQITSENHSTNSNDNQITSEENNSQIVSENNSSQEDTSKKEERIFTFRNQKLLDSHYEKHGKEMGFASAKEYEAAASSVVTNKEALHKIEEEDGDDVYYIESTNEFVVVSKDGYLRTYFYPSDGLDYFNRQ